MRRESRTLAMPDLLCLFILIRVSDSEPNLPAVEIAGTRPLQLKSC